MIKTPQVVVRDTITELVITNFRADDNDIVEIMMAFW